MRTELGIMVSNPGNNQPAFTAINHINTIHKLNLPINCTLFYRESSPFCTKLAGTSTTLDRVFNYYGHLIATDLDLAIFALRSRTAKSKILYPFNLDWIHGYGNYMHNVSIYTNKDLFIIAPSLEYAESLENYCGRKPDAIIPQFHIPTILGKVEDEIRNRTSTNTP